MMRNFLIFFLIITSCSFSVRSQRHYFVSFSVKEGLAQSQVRDIRQTQDGYLWIATIGGISRFDGHEFVTYNKSNGLPNNLVTSLLETSNNDLWAACKGGIVKFTKNGVEQKLFEAPYAEVIINDLQEFEGAIYLASNGLGLLKLNNNEITSIDLGNDQKNFIRSLSVRKNKMFIGSKEGLFVLKNNELDTIIPNISVSHVYCTESDVWVTTYGSGMYQISDKTIQLYTEKDGLRSNNQREICIDKNGQPWIIYKNGIDRLNLATNKFTSIKSIDPTHTTNLKAVFKDREGNMWVGTDGLGVLKYTGDQFETYTLEDGLNSEIIMSITQDSKGNRYFATYGNGVILQDSKTGHFSPIGDGLLNLTVWSLLVLNNDDLLIGTSDGINRYSDGKITNFEFNAELPWPRVSSMFLDSKNQLWIGTRDGILVCKDDEVILSSQMKNLEIKEVKSFTEIDETIWISSNSGLYAYGQNDSSFTNFNVQNSNLSENYILCLKSDLRGNLWLGTEEGLLYFNPKNNKSKRINLSNQVSSNIINSITLQNGEYLWLGTDNGLFSLSLDLWYESDSIVLKKFNEHDGVVGQECNQNASYKDSEGFIWFGTNDGLIKYDPSQDHHQINEIENIHITDILSNFESVISKVKFNTASDQNLFEYKENRLSFRYSAIYHNNPEKILYSYKLEGSDEDWSPETKENYVTYSNLPPGDYTFSVRAKLQNGKWSVNESQFSFEIQRPFWLSWWFILLTLTFFIVILNLVYLQINKERKRKKEFEELLNKSKILGLEQQTLNAHMNRHFIFNALNSIQYYINTQDKKMANMYLSNFASLVRKNLDSAQEESILLKDELDRLKLYMSLEQMRFQDRFDFIIHQDDSIDAEYLLVPSMILQPFVENSIIHGILPSPTKGKININIMSDEVNLIFEIRDNGVGIENSLNKKELNTSHHLSNGMKITKQRMELLGKISNQNYGVVGPRQDTDENGISVGTTVLITLPLNDKFTDSVRKKTF